MMPHAVLMGPGGYSATITTRDREMLAAWFAEWLPRLWGPGTENLGEPAVNIHPVWGGPDYNDDPDWLTDSRAVGQLVTIPRDPVQVPPYLDEWRAAWEPGC